MSKSKKPSKPTVTIETAHEVHALLDYMLVETVVENKPQSKRLSLPYSMVIKPDPEYENAVLVVEITTYWDAKRSKSERKNGPEKPEDSSKTSTRH